jgi:hypothetical protein
MIDGRHPARHRQQRPLQWQIWPTRLGARSERVMKRAGPVWTPYEDERLRALALSGTTAAKIAEQLNRSEGAVRKRATRLNIVLSSRARAPKTESEIRL